MLDKLIEKMFMLHSLGQDLRVWVMLPACLWQLLVELEDKYAYSALDNLSIEIDPYKGCRAFKDFIAVKSNGDVVGCPFMTKALEKCIKRMKEAKDAEIHTELYEIHLLYGRHELLRLYIEKHLPEYDDLGEDCIFNWEMLRRVVRP